jgi:hypothetical protein
VTHSLYIVRAMLESEHSQASLADIQVCVEFCHKQMAPSIFRRTQKLITVPGDKRLELFVLQPFVTLTSNSAPE